MKTVIALVNRNRKLFFKDRGMLFSAMITPGILIVLYATFLAKVYKDSFLSATKEWVNISDKLVNGTVAAQLAAALLAVSCVTVTFCVNLTMVQDRANGIRKDFNVSPVSRRTIYLGYFLSTVVNSLMVNGIALVLCLGYIGKMGWYMSATDVLWVILDELLLVLFGSTISSIISYPLTTQGQLSAVGTIVSAGYGFICGAYMPISNFGSGLQKVLSSWYIWYFAAEESYVKRSISGDEGQWFSGGSHYGYPQYAGLQSGFSRPCGDCKPDDCDYGGKCACVWRNLSVYDGTAGERSRVERNIDYCSKRFRTQ